MWVRTCCFKWPEVANFFGHHAQANAPCATGSPDSGPFIVLYPTVALALVGVLVRAACMCRRCWIVFAAAACSAEVCARRADADCCKWFTHAAVAAGAADVSMVKPVDNLDDMANVGEAAEAAVEEEVGEWVVE